MVEQGKYYEGEIRFIQARKMAEELQLPEMIAKANMNLGNIYIIRGLYEDAIKCYQKALDVNKDEDKELSTNIYINFAITYKFKRSYNRSIDYLNKALETNKETNIRYQKGLIYLTQGEIACLRKNLSAATALVTSAFTIFNDIGDRLSIGEAYKILGMINRENENYDVSLSYFENSKRISKNPFLLAETLVEMAKLFSDMGEKSRAKITLNQAIKNFRKIGADSKIDSAKTFFADIL
jgi:tetratricopeptide (TPR) repeat protein